MSKTIYLFMTIISILLVLLVLIWVMVWPASYRVGNGLDGGKMIRIGQTLVKVELARQPAELLQGLSGRESIGLDQGMLFLFDRAEAHRFWMKDMLFPLDFVWINDGQVVEITSNVPPPIPGGSRPAILIPREFVKQVLEVNGGWVASHDIGVGDKVDYINCPECL